MAPTKAINSLPGLRARQMKSFLETERQACPESTKLALIEKDLGDIDSLLAVPRLARLPDADDDPPPPPEWANRSNNRSLTAQLTYLRKWAAEERLLENSNGGSGGNNSSLHPLLQVPASGSGQPTGSGSVSGYESEDTNRPRQPSGLTHSQTRRDMTDLMQASVSDDDTGNELEPSSEGLEERKKPNKKTSHNLKPKPVAIDYAPVLWGDDSTTTTAAATTTPAIRIIPQTPVEPQPAPAPSLPVAALPNVSVSASGTGSASPEVVLPEGFVRFVKWRREQKKQGQGQAQGRKQG